MPEGNDLILISRWIDGPFRISHHPMCRPFEDHTLNVFGRDVCRGCLFWYPGIVSGLIIGLIINIFSIDKYFLAPIMFFLIAPTLLQLILHLPRPIKDIARFMLGLSTGFTMLIILGFPDLFVRFVVLIVFLLVFVPLTIVRNNKNESICQLCPELSLRSDNKCSGYKILRERAVIANTQLAFGISDINEVVTDVKSFDEI